MHARAALIVDQWSVASLERLFGDLPGGERLARYLQGKARRELDKLEPERLAQYLTFLGGLMGAVRTGEGFEEILALARQPAEREEPAA